MFVTGVYFEVVAWVDSYRSRESNGAHYILHNTILLTANPSSTPEKIFAAREMLSSSLSGNIMILKWEVYSLLVSYVVIFSSPSL